MIICKNDLDRPVDEVINNLPNRVSDRAREWINKSPEKLALVDPLNRWTYSDLGIAIDRAKELLQQNGVGPGDRIMVVFENCNAVVALLMAASEMDAWIVIVNARMSHDELDAIREDCNPKHVICAVSHSSPAKAYAAHIGAESYNDDLLEEFASISDVSSKAEPVFNSGAEQVFAMVYTSGTTGKPKGVMLTHKNIGTIAEVSGELRGLNQADNVYVVLPMSHIFGLASTCMGSLFCGATLYLEPRFEVKTCLNALTSNGITVLQGVPPMYSLLIEELNKEGLKGSDLNLRYMSVGGAPLDQETKKSTERFFGRPLHNGYGLSEASPTITQVRLNENLDNCSVGKPIPGLELRLMKDPETECGPGEVGELWVRGPNVMKGYFRKEAETKAILNSEGWLNTQDLAQLDDDENVYIVGRTKEMIVCSGFNVYPAEIEGVLNSYEEITQSAVVGVSMNNNEEVYAYVQAVAGSALTEDDVRSFCKEHLTAYKRPSYITIMKELPASSTGKILKSKLQAMATTELNVI